MACYPPRRLSVLSLPLAGEEREVPLYTADRGQFLEDVYRLSRGKIAEAITGGLSFPGKMDCPAWGIPAESCMTGAKLAKTPGTTCSGCYAMKGTFRLPGVRTKLERALQGLSSPDWTPAMTVLVRRHAVDRFRWFMSGDLQGVNHLRNIIRVCLETPDVLHWLPTREGEFLKMCEDLIPQNLRVRLSATKVDGPAPTWWPYNSTVVTDAKRSNCPSSKKGGNCAAHACTLCWSDAKNVAYRKH